MSKANFPVLKRAISFGLALSFGMSCLTLPAVDARQAYSSIQGNIREQAEVEPYEGGKKVGPVHDWELLCKIEEDAALKERVIKSAEEGSLDHVFILACMNLHGKGVEKNQAAAFELFKAAAYRGHSNSQNNLGFMYEEGISTRTDLKQALAWYRKAAEFNNASAICNLGNMYEHGRGVPADENEALKLYRKAAELGNKIASQNVDGIEFELEEQHKLQGIGNAKVTAAPAVAAGKNAKGSTSQRQLVLQQKALTYNPTSALAGDEPTTTAPQTIEAAKTESAPKLPTEAKTAEVTKAPAVVAKAAPTAKPVSANELVLNSMNARSKAAAGVKASAAQTAALATKGKNAKQAVAIAIKTPDKPVVAVEPPAATPEVKAAESGLKAGSPTLTAILNRLSEGTNLEQYAPAVEDKVVEQVPVKAPVMEDKKVEATQKLSAVPPVESKVGSASVKEKNKEAKPEAAKVEKPVVVLHETRVEKPVVVVLHETKVEKPAVVAEAPKVEKPAVVVESPRVEKPAVVVEVPKIEKTATVAEQVKAFETKKSALDTPVVLSPAPAEVKKSALDTPVVLLSASNSIKTTPETVPTLKADSKPVVASKVAAPTNSAAPTNPALSQKPAAATKPAVPTKPADPTKPAVAAVAAPNKSSATKDSKVLVDRGPNRPIRDKWALVVGITDFQDPHIPNLQYSAKDATDFYSYLTNEANFQPDHVRLLLNEQATQRRVLSELGSKFLARVVKPDDLVVLYFSTHGSPSQLDPRGKSYLVANDSDSEDLFATGIEMQKLLDSIQGRVLTDRVLLVMDACHSGFAATDAKGMGRLGNFKTEDLVQGSGQLVICSSLADERAWESTRYQNGVFTRKLLEGLRSKGSSTSLVDAYAFARESVSNEVKEDRPGSKQTPVLKGKWDGNDLIVATQAYAPQMVPASVSSTLGTDSRSTLVASALRNPNPPPVSEDDLYGSKANNDAPKSGIIYLDSQYFSVKGDPRAMARELFEAIKNNPSDPELYFLRAKALIQLEDWHGAVNSLSEAIQLSPNRAQYYLCRAYVNFRMGKKGVAQQDLEQARFYDSKMANSVRFHL